MESVSWVFPSFGHSTNEDATADYGHPSHRGFQKRIGADPILFPHKEGGVISGTFLESYLAARQLQVPESEIFVLENADALYAAQSIRDQNPDAAIILLAAHRVFGLESYDFSADSFLKSILRHGERYLDAKLVRYLIDRYVDGVLAVSDFVSEYVAGFPADVPIRTVYPYIQPEFAAELSQCSISVDGTHAITVCESRDHKGVDMLVDAWPTIRKRHSDATLGIIGDGHPDRYENVSGVSVHGYVEDLAAEYRRADLYIHPARADAFGVTVVEAMRAGTPAIVTGTTGSRDVVGDTGMNLVVKPSVSGLADGVTRYFDWAIDERRELAERLIRASEPFTEEEQLARFEDRYHALTSVI